MIELLLFMISNISCFSPYIVCPNRIPTCKCSRKSATAVCSNLTYIPEFPKGIQAVELQYNKFPNISNHFMRNLTNLQLTKLVFNSNNIQNIDENSFIEFNFLKGLKISNEHQLSVQVVMKSLMNTGNKFRLRVLQLTKNQWTIFHSSFFKHGPVQNVKIIDLSGNTLNHFPFESLSYLEHLKVLNLNHNKLIDVKSTKPSNVLTLLLSKNDIVDLHSFCINETLNKSDKPESNSYFYKLKDLHLEGNAISTLKPRMFRCLPNLRKLILSNNRFNVLPTDFLCHLPKIGTLFVSSMKLPSLIEPYAFRSQSLTYLNIAKNGFHFEKNGRFQLDIIFKGIPSLRILNLSNSVLPTSYKMMLKIFQHMTNLTSINLVDVHLSTVPAKFFQIFRSLETLILNGNNMKVIEEGAFENISTLRTLSLKGNSLQLINASSIPLDTLPSLKSIDISNNPFACTCDQLWFLNWIHDKNRSKLFRSFPKQYTCYNPEHMRGTLLADYRPTIDDCAPWNPYYTMAIALSSFFVLVFLVAAIIFKCNPNIRNCFYLIRLRQLKRKGYLRLDNHEDFEYHAFVIYCAADSDWVHQVFLPKLEDQNIRLCIHMRDFDAGLAITENITEYLQKSWKVVVVMSNSFAKSEWCQWETDLVHERRRRHGKGALVPIMFKNIDSNHMTSSIKAMIETTPYLTYTKGIGEDLFWRTVIESIRRPLNNPPVAI